jgi:hypothetical protein
MYGISIKKGVKTFRNDIYFNKKKRKRIKTNLLKIQKNILEGPDFSEKPVLSKEFEEREFKTSMLNLSVQGLGIIKDAEEFEKDKKFTNCKFELYKKSQSYVFKTTFFKPLKNENNTSYLVFENGLPENSRQKGYIQKNNLVDLKGFESIDNGSFRQKIINFNELELTFKGSKNKYKFLLKLIDEEKWSYWVSLSEDNDLLH